MLNYKGFSAVREHLTVSESMVDQQIERLLEQRVKYTSVTGRPTQEGDEIVLDYAGEVDGLFFEGGTATNQTLVLGSGTFIPGFEHQLLGKNIGDEADVNVTFPQQYHAANLAGKAAVFHCKINDIRIKQKYEANDEFAREVGQCETLAQFRENLQRALQDYVDGQADNEVKEQLINQICDANEIPVTDQQLEAAMDYELQMLEAQLGRQGLTLDMYVQFTGKSKEELREDNRAVARRNIQRQIAIDEIARLEGIVADEASISEALGQICAENNITLEELKPHMDDQFQAAVSQGVINTKVMDFILANSAVEVVEKEM